MINNIAEHINIGGIIILCLGVGLMFKEETRNTAHLLIGFGMVSIFRRQP